MEEDKIKIEIRSVENQSQETLQESLSVDIVDSELISYPVSKKPTNVYEIDFDKINDIDDIKKVLRAMSISFMEHTPGFFDSYLDIFKLKPIEKNEVHTRS